VPPRRVLGGAARSARARAIGLLVAAFGWFAPGGRADRIFEALPCAIARRVGTRRALVPITRAVIVASIVRAARGCRSRPARRTGDPAPRVGQRAVLGALTVLLTMRSHRHRAAPARRVRRTAGPAGDAAAGVGNCDPLPWLALA